MYIWGKGCVAGRVGSGQTFCRQSRVGSGRVNVSPGRVGSGPRKVTRGQLCSSLLDHPASTVTFTRKHVSVTNSCMSFGKLQTLDGISFWL